MVPAWTIQLARGILALGLGLTIALTLAHTPLFGLLTFGAFAVLSGSVLLVGATRSAYGAPVSGTVLAQGIVTIAAGVAGLVVPVATVWFLGLLVGAWALVAGLLEVIGGLRARGRSPLSRDWVIAGALTAALGVVALVLPADIVQTFSGERGQSGTLTSSVILIGVVGAWAVLIGVLQSISAVSVRPARAPSTASA